MRRWIAVAVSPGEARGALLCGDRVEHLFVDRDGAVNPGDMFLGRVRRVVPGLAGAFVDLGAGEPGFLRLAKGSSAPPVEGQALPVRVTAAARADRGPRLTTRLSLPGCVAALVPGGEPFQLSPRIDDAAERERLAALAGDLTGAAGAGNGVALRTAAAGADPDRLRTEIGYLAEAARALSETVAGGRAPAPLWREPALLPRLLRDHGREFGDGFRTDDRRALEAARAWCARFAPDLADGLELHDAGAAGGSLGEAAGIDAAVEAALGPRVRTESGAALEIAETHGATVIDVDSASHPARGGQRRMIRAVNLEAASAIARQIRLRELSGLIAIDFIHMDDGRDREAVRDALGAALATDRQVTGVGRFTEGGLIEVTRMRRRTPLADIMTGPCPACDGRGRRRSPETVALAALARALREGLAAPAMAPGIVASPAVIDALEGPLAGPLADVAGRLGRSVGLGRRETGDPEAFDVEDGRKGSEG